MKVKQTIKANAILMLALTFLNVEAYEENLELRKKIDKVLQGYNNKRSVYINQEANKIADKALENVKKDIEGSYQLNVQLVSTALITYVDEEMNMPSKFGQPMEKVKKIEFYLIDTLEDHIISNSFNIADKIIKEII